RDRAAASARRARRAVSRAADERSRPSARRVRRAFRSGGARHRQEAHDPRRRLGRRARRRGRQGVSRRAREARMRALGLAVFLLIAVAIGGVYYGLQRFQPAEYDPETLCVYGGPLPPHTAVVLDKTDEYTEAESARIAALIRRAREELAVGERITVFELDARG